MNSASTTALPKVPSAHPHRLRRPVRYRWVMVVAVAAVAFLFGSFLFAQRSEQAVEQERDAAASQAIEATDPIRALCTEDSVVGEALRADLRNPCGLAEQVLAAPIPVVEPPAEPADVTDARIQAAVAAELARNPPADGRTPTTSEVAAIVAQYLTANPPTPGRPPTATEIENAVAAFVARNPVRNGTDGRDAPPPTPEQIRAAVAAELAANPPARGEPGARGAQGVGVSDVRTALTPDGCLLVFTLTNPADGSVTEQTVPVPDDFCVDTDDPVIEIP